MEVNVLAGTEPERILSGIKQVLATPFPVQIPFADGQAAARIVAHLVKELNMVNNP